MTKRAAAGLIGLILLGVAAPAAAQPAANALAGKTFRMIIGFGVGGGYDHLGPRRRPHMGKHLPGNPTLCRRTCRQAAAWRRRTSSTRSPPRTAPCFGLIGRDAPLAPITSSPGARFEPTKMSWLGTPTKETNSASPTARRR